MSRFVGVLLQEGLSFSQEHVEEIKCNIKKFNEHEADDVESFNDDQLVLAFRGSHIEEVENEQPFQFQFGDDQYCLVFNGEIYNDTILRDQLEEAGYQFKTTSTIEVIANLFLEHGIAAFGKLRGMFALLIWDQTNKRIYGARDRFGIKPLYYIENEHETVFTSEKKLITYSGGEEKINQEGLQDYLTYQYVPEPKTLTEGIYKVKPGHYFIKEMGQQIKCHRYFHVAFTPVLTDRIAMMKDIRETLIDSVHVHMNHGKEIGSFLSGGVDSSLMAVIGKEVNPNIKTFSVGFADGDYSEIEIAKKTADQLQIKNISYVISPEEYIEKLPEIMWHMDDPLADPSCVPLYFAACEARKHVDTVMSGEGADEFFGGYNIYCEPDSLRLFKTFPKGINSMLHRISVVFPEGMKGKSFLERGTTPLEERYIGNAKMFDEDEKQRILKAYDVNHPYQLITEDLYQNVTDDHDVHKMQYIDIHTWLPGDILLKAEKMTQAHSLAIRTPFLDKEVFEIAKKVPVHEKIGNGTTKLMLREAFKGFVPDEVLYRRKLGFPVPIRHWLKDDFYPWARQLIMDSETDHIIDKKPVLHLLEKHRKNKGDYARKIWTILMFMVWHQVYVEQKYDFTNKADDQASAYVL